jgi:rhamnosyltransferase
MINNLYKKDHILAVLVSYNPDETIEFNIKSFLNQVSHLLIVDNGSNDESLVNLRKLRSLENVSFIFNDSNMGIAHALNQGVDEAIKKGYQLLLTLDQDTSFYNNTVSGLLDVINMEDDIVSVGSRFDFKERTYKHTHTQVGYLITSGNLTRLSDVIKIGAYTSKLFVDGVDFDFSLRLRNAGGKLALANFSKMRHNLGTSLTLKWLIFSFKINYHSPIRHYYIFRNHRYLFKTFLKRFPLFVIYKEINLLTYAIKILLFFPKRHEHFRMILRGVSDAFLNKYGQYSNTRNF